MIYKEIENLVTDHRFQELKFKQEKTNIFTIVGQTHTEHWHSSFFSWLLDPGSSLRLGHFPLARLLNLYMIKREDCPFSLKDIYSWNLDELHFQTEKDASMNGKKRSIDVYGESSELIIIIENKVNARENFNRSPVGQTKDYFDHVNARKKPEQRILCFFFTPDIRQEAYADMYVQVTYQELFDNIIAKCLDHPQLSEEGKVLLEQYAANLRETVHNSKSPMALTNIDLCKSLYEEHSEILDQIFNAVNKSYNIETSDDPACLVYHRYQDIFDEIYLSVEEKYGMTPKATKERVVVTFTELFKHGLVKDGMRFTMKYDNVIYQAKIIRSDKGECFLQLLDENGDAYLDKNGNIIGVYPSSSAAGVDAINYYRKKKGETNFIKTLRGTTYWQNEEGYTIKDLIDRL